ADDKPQVPSPQVYGCTAKEKESILTGLKKVCTEVATCLKGTGLEECFKKLCAKDADWIFVCAKCAKGEEDVGAKTQLRAVGRNCYPSGTVEFITDRDE